MLNIDELRYNWEKPFLELMDGMQMKTHPDKSNYILWYKNNTWHFEQNEENDILYCSYTKTWSVFQTNYTSDFFEIQLIVKKLMKKYYNLLVTPMVF